MIRGITLMKCTECGNRFRAPDIELWASEASEPTKSVIATRKSENWGQSWVNTFASDS